MVDALPYLQNPRHPKYKESLAQYRRAEFCQRNVNYVLQCASRSFSLILPVDPGEVEARDIRKMLEELLGNKY